MIERRLEELWLQLQGKKPHLPHFLSEVRLQGLRGIDDLRVPFDYPVSVIAGENASGKSTVLFSLACAYKVPGAGVKDFVPSTLFPDYRPKSGGRGDEKREILIEFDYATPEGRRSMRWRRVKGWNRSFLGRKGAEQPERPLYLRTSSGPGSGSSGFPGAPASSPVSSSECAPSIAGEDAGAPRKHEKSAPQEIPLTASQIEFAQRILSFRYSEVVDLSSGSKNFLFAAIRDGATYSELHMAAGERSILRLSQEIAQLHGALVLIDEVEAGLHPWVQQNLMLQLQQLALRNDLQIVVTTHSPVVLDSVPAYGRIFLEREPGGGVAVRPPYRDVVQSALYGRAADALNLLCEDAAAESVLQGVLDFLAPRMRIVRESLRIGPDTGADEFPTHAAAFRKFGRIRNFVFILDGDKRDGAAARKIREKAGEQAIVLFLPGREAPEFWVWSAMRAAPNASAEALRAAPEVLSRHMNRLDSIYDSASDRPSEIAKYKLRGLSDALEMGSGEICRSVARLEAAQPASDIQPLVEELEAAFLQWRDA